MPHQGVDSEHFLQWLISCLQEASSLLGLETRVKAKQEELQTQELFAGNVQKCAAIIR